MLFAAVKLFGAYNMESSTEWAVEYSTWIHHELLYPRIAIDHIALMTAPQNGINNGTPSYILASVHRYEITFRALFPLHFGTESPPKAIIGK